MELFNNEVTAPSGWNLRDDQYLAVSKILKAFANGKKVVALQGPTGSGKSVIGRSITNSFSSSYYLVPLKALQDQIWNDFEDSGRIAMLKGKGNYNCAKYTLPGNVPIPVDQSSCQRVSGAYERRDCIKNDTCPYYTALEMAKNESCSIMNFMLYLCWRLVSAKMASPMFGKRTLHVIDEAHKVEDFVRDFLTIELREDQVKKRLGIDAVPERNSSETSVIEFLKEANEKNEEEIGILLGQYGAAGESELRQLAQESSEIAKEVDYHLDLSEKMKWFLSDEDRYAFGFEKRFNEHTKKEIPAITAKPLYVGGYIRTRVVGEYTLLMSATLPKQAVINLGFEEDEIEYIEMPSTFPKENRPVFFTTVGKMNKDNIKSLIPLMARKIDKILDKAGDQKGLIHTPSYEISELLYKELSLSAHHGRIIKQEKKRGGMMEALSAHKSSKSSSVLLSPGMKEGVDLKGDLSRFQIIVKCPYPSLGDPAVAKMAKNDYLWYATKTIVDFMQMYGRSVRSKEDWARTYFLDESAKEFLWRHRNMIPKYITEAIHW